MKKIINKAEKHGLLIGNSDAVIDNIYELRSLYSPVKIRIDD